MSLSIRMLKRRILFHPKINLICISSSLSKSVDFKFQNSGNTLRIDRNFGNKSYILPAGNKMDESIVSLLMLFASTSALGFSIAAILHKFNLPTIWKSKIDQNSKRNGGERVAEVLKAHGVKFIFTLVGGHISPILVESEKAGIRIIDTRQEVTAVFAADAIGRISGTVGVAAVTAGPGVTNTITAVKNAQMAESPVLILGGAAAGLMKGRGSLQDIDQLSLFKPICKHVTSVSAVREIIPIIKKAIHIAQSGIPGPVFVELPIDVLYQYEMVATEIASVGPGKSLKGKIIHWYVNNYLQNIFAGAWDEYDTSPLQPNIPISSLSTVQECANIISQAKKPLLIIGSQATLPPTPVEDVRKALESMGIPCYLGGMARGLLGDRSPLHMRQRRKEALQEADVIILAGAICDFRLSYGRSLNRKAKIISINRCKEQVKKNADMFWKPAMSAIGDVGTFLKSLSPLLADYECPEDWSQKLRERDLEKENSNHKIADITPLKYINPLKLCYSLEKQLPENTILIADGGDFVATAAYTLKPRGPLTWLDPGAFGTLGVGAGFALAAKLCRPESEVWIIYGDGSFGYSMIEFDTFVRHKIPVAALIGNDAGWTQIAREQVPMLNASTACNLMFSNYHESAVGLGSNGLLLKETDDIDLKISEARNLLKNGKPVVINAFIGKSSFRDGSISV